MFAEANVIKEGNTLHVTHGSDKECWVEFRKHPVFQQIESEEKGRPIFKDVDYIAIRFPGDKTKMVDRPVQDQDKLRFAAQWHQFEQTGIVTQIGTPLEEWPPITKSQALELKGLGIHTVEQLSNLGDGLLGFLGAREYREAARKYLEKASGSEAQMKMLNERMDELMRRNAELSEQLAAAAAEREQAKAETVAHVGAVEVAVRKKPGRKPKDTAAAV